MTILMFFIGFVSGILAFILFGIVLFIIEDEKERKRLGLSKKEYAKLLENMTV